MVAPESRSALTGDRFYARAFGVGLVLVLGVLVYRILSPLFSALVWSALIALLAYPLHVRFTALLRGRENLSASLLTLATVVILLGPVAALGAAFVVELAEIAPVIEDFAREQAPDIEGGVLQPALERIQQLIGVSPAELRQWAGESAKASLEALAGLGGKIFVGAFGTALGFTVAIFALFFLLRDGQAILDAVQGLIPLPDASKTHLNKHLRDAVHALVFGIGLTAVIQGVMLGAAFAVLGLPAPVVFGAVGILVALLPVVGTPLLWGPAAIVLAVQGRWGSAIALLAWGVLVSTVDNFLRPFLVSGRAPIGTLTVFLGVIGGAAAFGMVGLLLGPLILALCLALIRFALEHK
ncbi:hypothetical protein CAI21_09635 [Alkalilimnicola ehrlichii]|uniref:AI-2E family transporter n=1 Tax=Alkalilimnicola ehrlichii TaxID=351052 RepID=A0A3E0WWT1_9GAMM|nr:AI-2E family transporter [Alkalilimnicola ehrlichii]RFA29324.1 hypothetical protein CAI21_09635 [Alkalilimnicola ehrlichii]RFA36839.1 hypothetical protein CAL65_09970 [Alkalilimnicola ehrlichii]